MLNVSSKKKLKHEDVCESQETAGAGYFISVSGCCHAPCQLMLPRGLTHEGRSALTRGAKDCNTQAQRGQSAGSPITFIFTLPASGRNNPLSARGLTVKSNSSDKKGLGLLVRAHDQPRAVRGLCSLKHGARGCEEGHQGSQEDAEPCLDFLDFHLTSPLRCGARCNGK